jgi:3-oxoacyl-[acyl-carrier protein] reductase
MSLEGQIALVTGGGSGIGAAVAAHFARLGAKVVVGDNRPDQANAVAADLRAGGYSVEAAGLDVTDETAMAACVEGLVAANGGLDHLVAAAGIATRHTIAQMPVEVWRRVIDVNLTGAFVAIKVAADAIGRRGGGTITLISSIAAEHLAYHSGAHYAASKTALTGLVRQAAFELGRRNIRVNAVAPGPMTNRMGGGETDPERRKASARNLPLQRVVEPADIAEVCAFLASPAARAVTGAYLPVDNGFLTGRGVAYRGYFEAHEEGF